MGDCAGRRVMDAATAVHHSPSEINILADPHVGGEAPACQERVAADDQVAGRQIGNGLARPDRACHRPHVKR